MVGPHYFIFVENLRAHAHGIRTQQELALKSHYLVLYGAACASGFARPSCRRWRAIFFFFFFFDWHCIGFGLGSSCSGSLFRDNQKERISQPDWKWRRIFKRPFALADRLFFFFLFYSDSQELVKPFSAGSRRLVVEGALAHIWCLFNIICLSGFYHLCLVAVWLFVSDFFIVILAIWPRRIYGLCLLIIVSLSMARALHCHPGGLVFFCPDVCDQARLGPGLKHLPLDAQSEWSLRYGAISASEGAIIALWTFLIVFTLCALIWASGHHCN